MFIEYKYVRFDHIMISYPVAWNLSLYMYIIYYMYIFHKATAELLEPTWIVVSSNYLYISVGFKLFFILFSFFGSRFNLISLTADMMPAA